MVLMYSFRSLVNQELRQLITRVQQHAGYQESHRTQLIKDIFLKPRCNPSYSNKFLRRKKKKGCLRADTRPINKLQSTDVISKESEQCFTQILVSL